MEPSPPSSYLSSSSSGRQDSSFYIKKYKPIKEIEESESESESDSEDESVDCNNVPKPYNHGHNPNHSHSYSHSQTSDSESPFIVTKKKFKTESNHEKTEEVPRLHDPDIGLRVKQIETMSQGNIPLSFLNYALWLNDLRRIMLFFYSLDINALSITMTPFVNLRTRLHQHILSKRTGYGIKGSIRDNIKDMGLLDLQVYSFAYLYAFIEVGKYTVKNMYSWRRDLIKWRKETINCIMTKEKEIEWEKIIYTFFYYLTRKGDRSDRRYDCPVLFREYKHREEDEKGGNSDPESNFIITSEFFMYLSEPLFYHGIRDIFLSNSNYYLEPSRLCFPPPKCLRNFVSLPYYLMNTNTQKNQVDSITCEHIPHWLHIPMESDMHQRWKGEKSKPPELLLLTEYRSREVGKWAKFIKTYSGLCKYWLEECNYLEEYIYGDSDVYMPIFEEMSIKVFRIYILNQIKFDIEKVVVEKEDIDLPLRSNEFYNSKYPRIVSTPMGYCLFDVREKKLLGYKSSIVCIYAWLLSIGAGIHNLESRDKFVKTKTDAIVDASLDDICKFVKKVLLDGNV